MQTLDTNDTVLIFSNSDMRLRGVGFQQIHALLVVDLQITTPHRELYTLRLLQILYPPPHIAYESRDNPHI